MIEYLNVEMLVKYQKVLLHFGLQIFLPITTQCKRGSHLSISSSTYSVSRTGCTISSGEYDLITFPASFSQNTCTRSAPHFKADMAAKYGAPVYRKHPPKIAIRPHCPFRRSLVSFGTIVRTYIMIYKKVLLT